MILDFILHFLGWHFYLLANLRANGLGAEGHIAAGNYVYYYNNLHTNTILI